MTTTAISNWPRSKLGFLVREMGGSTPSKERTDFWGGDVPWVSPKDMKVETIVDSLDHVTQAALSETSLRFVPVGSVLMVVRGMILAHTVPVALTGALVTLNQDMKALVPGQRLSGLFLRYCLKAHQDLLLALVEEAGHGTRCLRTEQWRKFDVPLPPLPTQKAIADFLDRKTAAIDALVEKKQKLLDLLAEKRAALINQAVTKGLDPNVPMKDSGIPWIREIPAHWEVKRLKFVCTLETGHTPSRSEPSYWVEEECVIPWVSLNDTKTLKRDDYISETTYKISPLGMANSAAHLIPAGSVVFTRDATIGLTAILTKPMAVSQHIIGWVCGTEVDNEFLLQVLGSMAQELDRVTFGATLKTIGMADVKELTTPLPPLEVQRQIVAHLRTSLERLDEVKQRLLGQIERLQEYRQALITAAVTGQLDIPPIEGRS